MSGIWNGELLRQAFKILFASILSCSIGYGIYFLLQVDNSTILIRLAHVFIPIGSTGLVYYFTCSLLSIPEVSWVKRKILKK
jgi:hypothetical protein